MSGEAELTVGELNDILNKLANASGGDGQVKLFSHLIQVTTATQMRWIVQIVLRDLKVSCTSA
jgi:DNA ligase-4